MKERVAEKGKLFNMSVSMRSSETRREESGLVRSSKKKPGGGNLPSNLQHITSEQTTKPSSRFH